MIKPGLQVMREVLTKPYQKGAESLDLILKDEQGGWNPIQAYDFGEYLARYQVNPAGIRYVLYSLKDCGRDPVLLEIEYSHAGAKSTCTLSIPAGTVSGSSFAIPLPEGADHSLRLLRLRESHAGTAGKDHWRITALLGNMAKLIWVLSWEKDQIRWHLKDINNQRVRSLARGISLDTLGRDLRVPRFPPRAYSYDPHTIALYHLDSLVANNGEVFDETAAFGLTGHPGTNKGAQSGMEGHFAQGFRFAGSSAAGGHILVPGHEDFDLSQTGSFTLEAFIKPARELAIGEVQTIFEKMKSSGSPLGWSLELGNLRGIPNNLALLVADGINQFTLYADTSLACQSFSHVAAVIDRASSRLRLYVEGRERASTDIRSLTAIKNGQDILIGRGKAGSQFYGSIDEIRFSKSARQYFDPVLGESDQAYRKRLELFEKWLLPTPEALQEAINSHVQINGQEDSFVLIERDKPYASASALVRILPQELLPAMSIDGAGNLRVEEREVCGGAKAELDFRPYYLFNHDEPEVDYGSQPNNHLMQLVTRDALDKLIALLKAHPPVPGRLRVHQAYNPENNDNPEDLHTVGRALRLGHESLSIQELGIYAHRAGFSYVKNTGAHIHASMAPGEKIEAQRETPVSPRFGDFDLLVGDKLDFALKPEGLPQGGEIRWSIIRCAKGEGRLERHPEYSPPSTLPAWRCPKVSFKAEKPGYVSLKVEYTYSNLTVKGVRRLRIGIKSLPNKRHIAWDGDMTLSEEELMGSPREPFFKHYLIKHSGLSYGAHPNNRKMQIGLERPLNRLRVLLRTHPLKLRVVKAYDPAGPGQHRVGRALLLRHQTLSPPRLAALAHLAGFDFVQRRNTNVYCAVGPQEVLQIVQRSPLRPLAKELIQGEPLKLSLRPGNLPADGSFNWGFKTMGPGRGDFDFVLRSKTSFTPHQPGWIVLHATYLEKSPQGTLPYVFEVRLKDSLDKPQTIIPKDKYDILMNILNYFHCLGVEVITENIREHVVEVKQDLSNAFPGYTYPDFRI